jgi:hypothetical protein
VSVTGLLVAFRVMLLALPPLVGYVTYRLCREAAAVRDESGPPPVVERTPDGSYEVVEPPGQADEESLEVGPPRA